MYSYGPQHMAEQKQDDQLELTYCSYVRIRDVALKTCRRWWTIGRSGERGSGISVLAAQHDDDDDHIYIYIHTHTHIYMHTHTHTHTHTHIYIHVHIYTHTHIYILSSTDKLFSVAVIRQIEISYCSYLFF